jgi:hypothetical protein
MKPRPGRALARALLLLLAAAAASPLAAEDRLLDAGPSVGTARTGSRSNFGQSPAIRRTI